MGYTWASLSLSSLLSMGEEGIGRYLGVCVALLCCFLEPVTSEEVVLVHLATTRAIRNAQVVHGCGNALGHVLVACPRLLYLMP